LSIVPTAATPLRADFPGRALAISADATQIVYVSSPGTLVVRAFDRLEPRTIAGLGDAQLPVFSPDGQWIAFLDGNTIKKVATAGGPVQTVTRVNGAPTGLSWGPNDVIVLSVAGGESPGLQLVSAAGGLPEVLTTPDVAAGEAYHHLPEMLPDGQGVLFGIFGSKSGSIGLVNLRTRTRRALVPNALSPHYVAPGYLMYVSNGALFAARFDVTRQQLMSAAVPVGVEGIREAVVGTHVSIARDGTVIYIPEPPPYTLAWVDRQNRREPLEAPPRRYWGVRLSPDGTRAVLTLAEGFDLWVWGSGKTEHDAIHSRIPSAHYHSRYQPDMDTRWDETGVDIRARDNRGVGSVQPVGGWDRTRQATHTEQGRSLRAGHHT
jgi:hypothetical protein